MTTDIEKEIDKEHEVIKYALRFLLANLDDDVVDDLSEYMKSNDYHKVEQYLKELTEGFL